MRVSLQGSRSINTTVKRYTVAVGHLNTVLVVLHDFRAVAVHKQYMYCYIITCDPLPA